MSTKSVKQLKTITKNVRGLVEGALADNGGLLRLAPCWVPRSFLQPGKRLKLHPDDLYAFGLNRGGIDERWFASTTPAANDNRTPDEGLSYVVVGKTRFTLQAAVAECGAELIGRMIWSKYKRWPVYSKFFDNMGPIPHHMHQSRQQARLVGQEGKPESYYFPPQHNNVGNNFPYTFMGLEPGTTKAQVRKCLENWNKGDNGILDLSRAYRLKPGSGWLIGPSILHAPGSLCTYEPQWGSDVFGMYQSLVEGREVPWALLVKDMPRKHHHDLDFIVEQLDWEANVDPHFKDHHYLEPLVEIGPRPVQISRFILALSGVKAQLSLLNDHIYLRPLIAREFAEVWRLVGQRNSANGRRRGRLRQRRCRRSLDVYLLRRSFLAASQQHRPSRYRCPDCSVASHRICFTSPPRVYSPQYYAFQVPNRNPTKYLRCWSMGWPYSY